MYHKEPVPERQRQVYTVPAAAEGRDLARSSFSRAGGWRPRNNGGGGSGGAGVGDGIGVRGSASLRGM